MNINTLEKVDCILTILGDLPIQTGHDSFGFPIVFVYAGQEIIWHHNLHYLQKRLEYLGLI